jgi:hypothetical protein
VVEKGREGESGREREREREGDLHNFFTVRIVRTFLLLLYFMNFFTI